MPPLKAEHFTGWQENSSGVEDRKTILEGRLFTRVEQLLPYDLRTGQREVGFIRTPQALYKVEGQPDGEYTRAWLQRDMETGYTDVTLVTDRAVRYGGGSTVRVEFSRFEHLTVDEDKRKLRVDENDLIYLNATLEQKVDFLEAVHETLDLIEAEVKRVRIPESTIA